jgi:hypothetical protein
MGHYTPSEAIATLIYRYAERIDAGDFAVTKTGHRAPSM